METTNLQNDPVFEKIKEQNEADRAVVEPVLERVLEIFKEELDAENDFNIKHGYLVLSKAIVYLSQALCDTEEMFANELEAAQRLAIDRMMPAVLPKIEDGKITEEGYDLENLSVRRLMMATGTLVDYIFWRNDISKYRESREAIEAEQEESANIAD